MPCFSDRSASCGDSVAWLSVVPRNTHVQWYLNFVSKFTALDPLYGIFYSVWDWHQWHFIWNLISSMSVEMWGHTWESQMSTSNCIEVEHQQNSIHLACLVPDEPDTTSLPYYVWQHINTCDAIKNSQATYWFWCWKKNLATSVVSTCICYLDIWIPRTCLKHIISPHWVFPTSQKKEPCWGCQGCLGLQIGSLGGWCTCRGCRMWGRGVQGVFLVERDM